MSTFVPLKRSQLSNLKEGTKLFKKDGQECTLVKHDETDRPVGVWDETESFKWLYLTDVSLKNPQGDVMDSIKKYLEKHRDIFLTIGIVLILDHFVFEGAFREKLKSITESFLDKKTREVTNGE